MIMIGLSPGWADEYGAALADGDEQARCAATGLRPRRCFRVNQAAREASARLGGQKGATSKRQKRAAKP